MKKKLKIYHKKQKKKDLKKDIQITKEGFENGNIECIKDDEQINLIELIKEKEINENEEDENNDFDDLSNKEEEEGEIKDSKSKPIANKEEKKQLNK